MITETLFRNVLTAIKEHPELSHDIIDSFSENQFASKRALINVVDELCILDKESTVVIWGSWYGSILIPSLTDKVKKIVCIDLDPIPLQLSKNRLFSEYVNVEYICDDVFNRCLKTYVETNLIINTSCEHMLPMKEWKWFGPGAIKEDGVPEKILKFLVIAILYFNLITCLV